MTEHTFIEYINRKIKSHGVYVWKINANFANGVPDAYYSAPNGDAWVEYKYGRSHELSALQHKWLTDRYAEGRRCWLVWGSDEGVLVYKAPPYPRRVGKDTPALLSREAYVKELLSVL
jgi:hypothetical protein